VLAKHVSIGRKRYLSLSLSLSSSVESGQLEGTSLSTYRGDLSGDGSALSRSVAVGMRISARLLRDDQFRWRIRREIYASAQTNFLVRLRAAKLTRRFRNK
jgi:hypothetical protein